ncbi:MAG: flagellar motor switch protein FliG [Phycisphaerae bacterium]|nr:flagellar motor switch protein FliG [Phycisphaerae bacterium]
MHSQPGSKLPERIEDLDGVTKAAILLLVLEPEVASELLKQLSTEMVEDVTRRLASLGEIPTTLSREVVEQFYFLSMSPPTAEGGFDYARDLLQTSLEGPDAERLIEQIQAQVKKSPFSFLQKAESANLLAFIQDEHPQTIALILSHLPHHKSSEILAELPQGQQVEVIRRVAVMEQTDPEVIREVEAGLESRLSSLLVNSMDKVGGIETVAEMLNLCDRGTERTILEGMSGQDPELVEDIRRLMFVFEDINLVDDRGIQAVLKEVDNEELCLALRTASDSLKQRIFSNMSTRAMELIQEDMEYMGPVRISDVEAAQQRIVDIIRRLEDAGEIIITGRGHDADLVV